ncbi:MAG: hypothetical protein ABJE99_10740 [Roseobacter sp.]
MINYSNGTKPGHGHAPQKLLKLRAKTIRTFEATCGAGAGIQRRDASLRAVVLTGF